MGTLYIAYVFQIDRHVLFSVLFSTQRHCVMNFSPSWYVSVLAKGKPSRTKRSCRSHVSLYLETIVTHLSRSSHLQPGLLMRTTGSLINKTEYHSVGPHQNNILAKITRPLQTYLRNYTAVFMQRLSIKRQHENIKNQ